MEDEVVTEVDGAVMSIVINRPEARNSVNRKVAQGLANALHELDERSDIHVGVLTGAGPNFCAGMDLKAFLRGESARIDGRGFAGIVEAPPRKPLIAAVEGYALAGGLEIALVCDLVVASESARFGLPEVKRGLVAAAGGLFRLPRQLPARIAMELVLTGEMIDAQRALAFGFVNRVVPVGSARAQATALAHAIASNGPLAVAASKQILLESEHWPAAEKFRRQAEITGPVFASEDAREGASAFAEKRAPVWRAR